MIFQRAARREFAHSTAGVFTALFAIMVTTQLIRLLNEAAQGSVDAGAVAALLGFAALNYLPPLLSLSLFVAILLSLSRSYRDSEMVVWFSSGLSLTAWMRPVLTFALPLVVTIAALSLFLSPWALSQSAEFRGKLSNRKDAGQVAPGRFQESSSGDRVIFVEGVADDTSHVRNVFVNELQPDRLGVTMAGTGHQEIADNGDRFIVLQDGRRYELEPGTAKFRILEYARYAVRLETKEARGIERTPKNMPLVELLQVDLPVYRAELLWRLGMPLSAIVLVLLAIPLAFVNPRAGRSANMLLAILVYVLYNNLLTISEGWVASGRLSFAVGLLAAHLLMLFLLPLMFYHRIAVSSFRRLSR
ncbi:MAG: LPS export ABC transporter permease LptF [Candidatus Accumulibacter sp.]|uniref:LPS export ABC transporter permease LptF n=1 Tax=Accumulibacter sp. TaxID=2053492 RepID=UPI0019EF6B13|nr:LPS export ABC transporter permease LptF [Accumulibacter sp.]MBE2258410.1 LPS export ABC transporter permease LptF [Paracoccaceae bacterium]MCB1943243.1 LPS export ABC transporter permease LptF [Accumulibacter sp.]MCP5247522.1 LPS export ABC transporter permease LptF [Accumulibacter sp.]